ncbi:MAG: endonuclease/exonuclease/phosphatase family protein [Planctomycetota bacterium]
MHKPKVSQRFLLLSTALLAWVSWTCESLAQSNELIRVMSFNIRYGTANDGINRWDLRKEFLVETIRNFDPDMLGTQETLASQRDYLAQALDGYGVVAAGRDDGKDGGEMAALFYRKDRFEPIEQGHIWLSETPETVGSKGWDAALPRIATWVKLKDLQSADSKPILYLNAHLDHKGQRARLESCRLIRSKLSELGADARWIVTGDFNASPSEPPYSALFDDAADRKLLDTHRVVHRNPEANEGTFSSFDVSKTNGPRIDWIGCSEDFQVRLARIDRTSRDGRTPSDHFPVIAVLRPASKSSALRVLSYNIHHGRGVDNKLSLERIAAVIRQADADVVALQEVDQGCGRSDRKLQVQELEKLTGYFGVFGKAIDFDGGEYGQAVLSRWPIKQSTVHRLPNEQQPNGSMREQRIVLEAIVPSEAGTIRFLGTHLDHSKEDLREQQATAVDRLLDAVSFADTKSIATVLAGDFNDVPKSRTLGCFEKRWQVEPRIENRNLATYPSESPRTRIDYVAVDQAGRLVLDSLKVVSEPLASDHRPVVGELVIP